MTGKTREYEISSSLLLVPPPIFDNCINIIRNITNLMLASFGKERADLPSNKEVPEDSEHNRLLIKKCGLKKYWKVFMTITAIIPVIIL
jgi:hypothetical protein